MLIETSGIYRIVNTLTNQHYIGSATNVRKRLNRHRSLLSNKAHHNIKLQRSWNKYGEDYFIFEILEKVPNKADLISREQYWMGCTECVRHGFNIAPIAGSNLGMKHSKETKDKISLGGRGKMRSEETRARMSAAFKGRRLTDAQKEGLLKANLGRKLSDEHRKKLSSAHSNPSLETRKKLSAASKGRKRSKEAIEKTASAHRGVKRSELTRSNISQSRKGKPWSEKRRAAFENRVKLSSPSRLREAARIVEIRSLVRDEKERDTP